MSTVFTRAYIADANIAPQDTSSVDKDGWTLEYRHGTVTYRIISTFYLDRAEPNPYKIYDTLFTPEDAFLPDNTGRIAAYRKMTGARAEQMYLYRAGPTNDMINTTYCSIGQSQVQDGAVAYVYPFGYGYMSQATSAPPAVLTYSGVVFGQAYGYDNSRFTVSGSIRLLLTFKAESQSYEVEGSTTLTGINIATGQVFSLGDARIVTNPAGALTFTEVGRTPSIQLNGLFRFCGPVREEIVGVVKGSPPLSGLPGATGGVVISFVGKFS